MTDEVVPGSRWFLVAGRSMLFPCGQVGGGCECYEEKQKSSRARRGGSGTIFKPVVWMQGIANDS